MRQAPAQTYREIRLQQQAAERAGIASRIKLGFLLALIIVIWAVVDGCSGAGTSTPPATPTSTPAQPTPVSNQDATTTGVAVVSTVGTDTTSSPLALTAGGATAQLHAVLLLSNGSFTPTASVTWTSSAQNVATVNMNGVVTPNAAGSAQITASYLDNQNQTLISPGVTVNVVAAPAPTPTPPAPTPTPPSPTPPPSTAATPPTVVFVGDQITVALFAQPGFQAQHPMWISAGVAGETTTEALAAFQAQCISPHPQICHIEIGLNDVLAGVDDENGPQNSEGIEPGILQMIQEATAADIEVVVSTEFPSFLDFTDVDDFIPPVDAIAGPITYWMTEPALPSDTLAFPTGTVVANYWAPLTGGCGPFGGYCDYLAGLSTDDVTPNAAGLQLMEPVLEQALDEAVAAGEARKQGKVYVARRWKQTQQQGREGREGREVTR
jgi:Bacterial Ig-like domain (group 2)